MATVDQSGFRCEGLTFRVWGFRLRDSDDSGLHMASASVSLKVPVVEDVSCMWFRGLSLKSQKP